MHCTRNSITSSKIFNNGCRIQYLCLSTLVCTALHRIDRVWSRIETPCKQHSLEISLRNLATQSLIWCTCKSCELRRSNWIPMQIMCSVSFCVCIWWNIILSSTRSHCNENDDQTKQLNYLFFRIYRERGVATNNEMCTRTPVSCGIKYLIITLGG